MILLPLLVIAASADGAARTCFHCHPAETADAAVVEAIPAFSRKYRTSCTTCHVAPPKLNVTGEAFRLNGYRFPDNEQLLRKDDPVPLGEEPWKDLWPKSIWPGELPAAAAVALRIQTDVGVERSSAGSTTSHFRMPHDLYVLGGATLGDGISVFAETNWSQESGFRVLQAKVLLQNPLGFLPDRALNLWVGRQNLYLFTLADRQIDRAGRQFFRWQTFRPSDVTNGPAPTAPANTFSLLSTQPAVEINGLLSRRVSYGLGLAQGAGPGTGDNNAAKDAYYRLRWKLGGLGLDGRHSDGPAPDIRGFGQTLDRSLTLEHFGYLGNEPARGSVPDRHRHFGLAARLLLNELDLGAGYVWGRFDDPWGTESAAQLEVESLFAKIELLVLPWLMPSLKLERFDATARVAGGGGPPIERLTRVVPGVVTLIRQNVRGVVEAELLPRYGPSSLGASRPGALWVRLDVAF